MQACPFLDANEALCCLEDNIAILATNFGKIDAVFGQDVPICGVNMKRLWCEFACSPNKGNFANATGYAKQKNTG